jgi:26S proteasome regulatory subunit N2
MGKDDLLGYTFNLCQSARNIRPREFRLEVISVLVKQYGTLPQPDYSNVCFGLQYLNRPAEVAQTLDNLCKGTLENALQAYQIAFDLQETENQGFVLKIVANFKGMQVDAAPAAGSASATATAGDEMDVSAEVAVAAETTSSFSSSFQNSSVTGEVYRERVSKLKKILLEGFDIDLTLNFLYKLSHTDVNVLKAIKVATEGRSNVLHSATVVAHAYMNAGTTQDNFLRENLEWLGKLILELGLELGLWLGLELC